MEQERKEFPIPREANFPYLRGMTLIQSGQPRWNASVHWPLPMAAFDNSERDLQMLQMDRRRHWPAPMILCPPRLRSPGIGPTTRVQHWCRGVAFGCRLGLFGSSLRYRQRRHVLLDRANYFILRLISSSWLDSLRRINCFIFAFPPNLDQIVNR